MKVMLLLLELFAIFPAAALLSMVARRVIQLATRRAVRMAQVRPGRWRGRLRRLSDSELDIDVRKRQRADATARMLSHFSSVVIFVGAALLALSVLGVDPVYAISSAGFLGFALALSGQDIIKNLLSGTTALLEDRYGVGDEVTFTIGSTETHGTIDLVGATSVRLRTEAGATWHAGHGSIDTVVNHSQIASSSEIRMTSDAWADVEDDAARRLSEATNDVGLTGVVFLPELNAQHHPTGVASVTVRTNRPLSDDQKDIVKERLSGPTGH